MLIATATPVRIRTLTHIGVLTPVRTPLPISRPRVLIPRRVRARTRTRGRLVLLRRRAQRRRPDMTGTGWTPVTGPGRVIAANPHPAVMLRPLADTRRREISCPVTSRPTLPPPTSTVRRPVSRQGLGRPGCRRSIRVCAARSLTGRSLTARPRPARRHGQTVLVVTSPRRPTPGRGANINPVRPIRRMAPAIRRVLPALAYTSRQRASRQGTPEVERQAPREMLQDRRLRPPCPPRP